MKRLLGMFRERDAGGEARATPEPRPSPEPREAWSPEGELFFTPHAGPPLLGGEEAKSDAIASSPSPSKEQGASSPGLLPLEGHPLEASIIEALKGVYDPEIPVNIYELGLIYDVKLSPENDVFVKMTLTAPGCPVEGQMPGMVRASIEEHVPEARDVDVEIVWDPPWTTERMSEAAKLETGML
jgi:FeS assembly SUF system protein